MGYAKIPATFDELCQCLPRDRERTGLIAVRFDPESVCNFIHKHGLYEMVGVAALLT